MLKGLKSLKSLYEAPPSKNANANIFVCPFNVYREMPQWDMTIYVNTIEESPYEDTNKAFEEPKKEPTYTITDWNQVDDILEEVAYKLLNQEEE